MTIIRETPFLTAPAVTLAPSSILDQSSVSENPKFGWRQECEVYPDYNALDTLVPTTICPDVLVEKEFEVAPWVPAFSFSVYGGVKCKLIGLDEAEQARELARVFEANEAKGIEAALLGIRFQASDSGSTCSWDAPVDLTPGGGAVSPQVGIALLEGYFGQHYAGVPTLHIPRTIVSLLSHNNGLDTSGSTFSTHIGSKVVNGAGYEPSFGPTGAAPSAGEYWIYATGEVQIEKSILKQIDTVVLPGDGSLTDGSGSDGAHEDNTALALVERAFRVVVDGPVVAVRVEAF